MIDCGSNWGSNSIEELLDLPPMRDPDRCATMDVLTVLTSPAFFTHANLFRLVVSRMATLSLEFGNSDGSCLGYEWLGGVLGTYFGEYEAGSASAGLAWTWSRSVGSAASGLAFTWCSPSTSPTGPSPCRRLSPI